MFSDFYKHSIISNKKSLCGDNYTIVIPDKPT